MGPTPSSASTPQPQPLQNHDNSTTCPHPHLTPSDLKPGNRQAARAYTHPAPSTVHYSPQNSSLCNNPPPPSTIHHLHTRLHRDNQTRRLQNKHPRKATPAASSNPLRTDVSTKPLSTLDRLQISAAISRLDAVVGVVRLDRDGEGLCNCEGRVLGGTASGVG